MSGLLCHTVKCVEGVIQCVHIVVSKHEALIFSVTHNLQPSRMSQSSPLTKESPIGSAEEQRQSQIDQLKKQVATLEGMLKRARTQLAALESKKAAVPLTAAPNEVLKETVQLRVLVRSDERERWVECGLDDPEKEVELAAENYGLSDEAKRQLLQLVTDFKAKNGL